MKRKPNPVRSGLPKIATEIKGFDVLSCGGLPRSRMTLVVGGPGSGKTVFALQALAGGARCRGESGIFVAFEEKSEQILANASTFGWDLPGLPRKKLFFLDAQLSAAAVHAGQFDLSGMLAILEAKKNEMRARWIVFDGIDVLLTLMGNPVLELREIYRVRDWLAENKMTGILTAKIGSDAQGAARYGSLEFMVDCVVRFDRRLEDGRSVHRMQILKYRGSPFASGEFPMNIGLSGIEVAVPESAEIEHEAPTERVSAGFERLDSMLGGGVFRGSSTLITGAPGTAKTTLAAKFAEAACERGERTLFVSFDEGAEPIVRNLSSVGIRFNAHLKSGLLRLHSARAQAASAEEHLTTLKSLIVEHEPRCVVIDALSAISGAGRLNMARGVANRLMYGLKNRKITAMITALVDSDEPQGETNDLQISPNADTWIHLSYLMRSGERNRMLTIVKSRGTWHSNQVRELVLSDSGVSLTDVSTEGGQVMVGLRQPGPPAPVTGSVQSPGQRRGIRNRAKKSVKASADRAAK